jgi:wyosine [tRNA(Phe)-imidazoG37] synthetase (radical SAM superfamily)
MRPERTARYVFGPVPSRRLGRSLGVDLVPFKTCTYDCIYCQLGRTTDRTTLRKPYVPVGDVLAELKERLRHPSFDYITLSGSGEPTLHSQLGEIIVKIKKFTTIPVAVLTNGSLLCEPEVRRACALADVVLPTLTAANATFFSRIHRPCPEIAFPRMVEGLYAFREEFAGEFWLEVFLVQGVNDATAHIHRMKEIMDRLEPDRTHLNTVVRPPAEKHALRVPAERMRQIRDLLGPTAEVIANPPEKENEGDSRAKETDVLALLRRRPCNLSDIASGLSLHANEAVKYVQILVDKGLLDTVETNGKRFFLARA